MNCPSCGAPMRLASGNANLRCDYCNSIVVIADDDTGVQYLDEAAEFTCPACAETLWNGVLSRVQLHACKKCHGLLVTMGAFEELIENMRAEHNETVISPPANPADLQRKVSCPRCRASMDMHFYFGGGHAVMATCERCELHWLGGGMLMCIVRAPHESEAQAET